MGAGVFYGFSHQASLSASAKAAAVNREYEHKQKLIEQAKAEYSKKNQPPSSKSTEGDGMFCPILFIRNEAHVCKRKVAVRRLQAECCSLADGFYHTLNLRSFMELSLTRLNSYNRPSGFKIRFGGVPDERYCRRAEVDGGKASATNVIMGKDRGHCQVGHLWLLVGPASIPFRFVQKP